jgi:DNA-binding NarL/FixJ family response regulator
MSRPRILLADDHVLLLDAFEKLLAPEYDIVGKLSNGRSLIAAAEKLQPDVIVVDISMPLLNGLDAGREIRRRFPRIKLVFVTMNEAAELAAAACRIGASGYLLKRSAASELQQAIREALNGRTYITPLLTDEVVSALLRAQTDSSRELTPRQREVLQLLAEGHSMKQVACVLNVTPRTVAFHKYRMMEQLRITSNAELIQFAVRQHLV